MTKTGAAARPTMDVEPESLAETFELYKKPILITVAVLAVGGFGAWMWHRSGEIKETRAADAYATAEQAFVAGNVALAQPELERVATRYPGTTAGTQSAMLLAQVLFDQGKFAEGIGQLERALGGAADPLKAGMLGLIGAGHEGAGQAAEAAQAFERAAAQAEFESDRDRYRMAAARNMVSAGNVTGARSIYEAIAAREDSDYAGEARVRLGETTGKA